MPTQLLLAPAASGKTDATIQLARQTAVSGHEVRICVPTGLQARAWQSRLAAAGGALGIHVLTFDRLVAACLNEAGEAYTQLSDPVEYRLLRTVIDQLPLSHYAPLKTKPGFIQIARQLISELKSARINPDAFTEAISQLGNEPRLRELANIYTAYQAQLQTQQWADRVGLHWLAVEALADRAPDACRQWPLLIIDGFDDFTPIQLALLTLLADRVGQFTITLSEAAQITFPRYQRTRQEIETALGISGSQLPSSDTPPTNQPTLPHLADQLFTRSREAPIPDGGALTLREAPDRAAEARTAIRWLKQQIAWGGASPDQVALLARDIGPYRSFITQIAAEFGLPIRLIDGQPLAHSPVISALVSVLRLHLPTRPGNQPDLSRRPVIAAWRSPYFRWANGDTLITPAAADALDILARQQRVIGGLSQWQDAFAANAKAAAQDNRDDHDDETGGGNRLTQTAVSHLQAQFNLFLTLTRPPTTATMRGFVQWLESLIGPDPEAAGDSPVPAGSLQLVACARANPTTATADVAALRTLKDILRGLVWADDAMGQSRPLDFATFFNELSGAIAAAKLYLPPRPDQPEIMVANATQVRGLRFAAVAIMGLSEGAFPATVSEDPFLRDADRDALRQQFGFLLERSTQSAEREFFYEAIAATMPAIYALCQYAQRTYQAKKGERDALDFDDLESLSSHLLSTHPAIGSYWQGQIQAMLVDEFQDTNEQQRQFIRQLCPQPGKLFIVGDAKQSIYRFRGADVTVFATEKKRIAANGGHLIDLSTSYRAHETLLTGMNNLLKPILGEDGSQLPPWATPFAPLTPGGKPVARGLVSPFVEMHLGVGNKAEALPVAATALALRLHQLHQIHGLDYGEVAILCRASSAFQYYENALDAAGIPYLTVAGKGFYDRPEIRDLLNGLQAIADPHDDLALVGLLRSPACGLSDVSLYHLAARRPEGDSLWDALQDGLSLADSGEADKLETAVSLITDLNQQAGRLPAADIFKQFLDSTQYRAILRRIDQPRALRNVAKLLTDIHTSELISITEFLEYAHLLRDSGSREGEARAKAGGAVQIMSIHAAKGLEFPVVVLGDAGSGSNRGGDILIDPQLGLLLPTKNENDVQAASYQLGADLAKQQEEAEKARLLYVALTRAEQMLLVSGTATLPKTGQLSCKSWLGQLAAITSLTNADLSGYNEEGDEHHLFDTVLAETAVRTVVYEPNIVPLLAVPDEAALVSVGVEEKRPLLQDSLLTPEAAAATDDGTPERVWQVVPTAKRPKAPAWVIGSLVHEALALWRFPGPDFEAWLTARARQYGLTDASQLGHAQVETARFLRRFQAHSLYQEIASADRRLHEVPYSYERDGVTETGYIDLLYQRDVLWTLVDFKTDRARSEADFQKLLKEKGYQAQVGRYGTAVAQLMGMTPRLLLCFLNVENDVRILES